MATEWVTMQQPKHCLAQLFWNPEEFPLHYNLQQQAILVKFAVLSNTLYPECLHYAGWQGLTLK